MVVASAVTLLLVVVGVLEGEVRAACWGVGWWLCWAVSVCGVLCACVCFGLLPYCMCVCVCVCVLCVCLVCVFLCLSVSLSLSGPLSVSA